MNKYKKGDKVVIRKDLVHGKMYGGFGWYEYKEYMKEKDYVVIEEVVFGDYVVEGRWLISEKMIEGLYNDENVVNIKLKYNVGDKVLIPKILKSKCSNLDYLVVTGYKYSHHCTTYELNDEYVIEGRLLEGFYEDYNNKIDYNNIEYINYKMQHEDLHQSIYKNNLQYQIDKALDENNTELLIELSNLLKGGVMIDN